MQILIAALTGGLTYFWRVNAANPTAHTISLIARAVLAAVTGAAKRRRAGGITRR